MNKSFVLLLPLSGFCLRFGNRTNILLRRCGPCAFVVVPRCLRFVLTFIASGSSEHLNITRASGFPEHSSLGMHGIERTTHFLVLFELGR